MEKFLEAVSYSILKRFLGERTTKNQGQFNSFTTCSYGAGITAPSGRLSCLKYRHDSLAWRIQAGFPGPS